MRHIILLLVCMATLAVCALSQTPQTDADPVLWGTVTFTMPQSAIDAEIDGKVVMAIHVDKAGKPTKAIVAAGIMWPCSTTPSTTLDELYSDLAKTMLKLQFSPSVKDGKPVEKDVGLAFTLKNPKLGSKPVEVDFVSGKPIAPVISAGIIVGKLFSLPKPKYPAEAKDHREGGLVKIQVLVDEQGKVTRAGAIDGLPSLQYASREAACGAKFHPTTLDGKPVTASGVLTYNFVVQ